MSRRNCNQQDDAKFVAEKKAKYKGSARVKLGWLHFRWSEPRELDAKNVARLASIFRQECRRLDIHNHIPAIISQDDLDGAIAISKTSAEALLGIL